MTITLTPAEKTTIRTAAFGAVTLIAHANATSAHRTATNGSLALYSATGLVGHVLGEKTRDIKLKHKSSADLADQVLPALAESLRILEAHGEDANFRATVEMAIEAAAGGSVTPPLTAMVGKIRVALGTE